MLLFLFHRDVLILGSQARPYGLAIAAAIGSCMALYEWFRTERRRWLAGYAVFSLLAIYLHFFFGFILVVHLFYAVRVFAERRAARAAWKLCVAWLAIAVLSLPLLPRLRASANVGRVYTSWAHVTFTDLRVVLMRWEFLLAGILAALAIRYLFSVKFRRPGVSSGSFLFLLLTWWLLGPSIVFGVGLFGGPATFVPRYVSYSFPAQALLVTWLIWQLFELRVARMWALITVTVVTVLPAAVSTPRTGADELAPFVKMIVEESRNKPTPPVIFRSPFVEANLLNWRAGLSPDSYAFAPLVAYPIENRLVPVPYYLNSEARDYIHRTLYSELSQSPEVIWVTFYGVGNDWMIEEMRKAGFVAAVHASNDYSVVVFRR